MGNVLSPAAVMAAREEAPGVVDDLALVENFYHYALTYKGIEPARARQQRRTLLKFRDTLGGRTLLEVRAADLSAFLWQMIETGSHPNTVYRYRHLISPWYSWAWENGYCSAETLLRIRSVRNPRGGSGKSIPNPYTRTELAQFWRTLEDRYPLTSEKRVALWHKNWLSGLWTARPVMRHANRLQFEAITMLALDMGLRAGELYNTPLNDLHYDNEYIIVFATKTGKSREVPYSPRTREVMRRWLEFRTLLNPGHDFPWLTLYFVRDPATPLHGKPWRWLFRNRLGPMWGLQRLRHTCATERLRAGMPLEVVQRLLGHANIAQTLAYAQITSPDLKKKMDSTDATFAAATKPMWLA